MIVKNVVILNTITKEPIATVGEIEAPVSEVIELFKSGIAQEMRKAFASG